MTKRELASYLRNNFDSRVERVSILYNRQTGLSRGIAFVATDGYSDLLERGNFNVEGRTVYVMRHTEQQPRDRQQTESE